MSEADRKAYEDAVKSADGDVLTNQEQKVFTTQVSNQGYDAEAAIQERLALNEKYIQGYTGQSLASLSYPDFV